jgi:type I restriction enzyme M protein
LAKSKPKAPLTTAQQLGSLIKSARDIMRKDKGLSSDLGRLPMLTWIMFLKFLDDMEQIEESRAELRGEKYRTSVDKPYRWRDWAAKEDGITGPELLAFINQEEAVLPNGKKGAGLFTYPSLMSPSKFGSSPTSTVSKPA